MNPLKIREREGPEAKIQAAIIRKLKGLDWFCKSTHGNMFQAGFPDIFIAHKKYGQRWVEVKCPERWDFTRQQKIDYPAMHNAGVGIWILMSDSDEELMKLFKPANFWEIYYNYVHKLK